MIDVTIASLMWSNTARALGISNRLPAGKEDKCISSMRLVVSVLNQVQRYFNSQVVVTSGYRCEELNKAVGGVPYSQHMLGEAVDFYVAGISLYNVFKYIVDNVEYDQCIMYRHKGIIHLSVRPAGCVRKVALSK